MSLDKRSSSCVEKGISVNENPSSWAWRFAIAPRTRASTPGSIYCRRICSSVDFPLSKAQQDADESQDTKHADQGSDDPRNCGCRSTALCPQPLDVAPMLHGCQQESGETDADHEQRKPSRPDQPFPHLDLTAGLELEELVDREAERDERERRAHPRHQRAVDCEPRPLERQSGAGRQLVSAHAASVRVATSRSRSRK